METAQTSQTVEESRVAEKYAHKLIRTLRVRLADTPGKFGEVATVIGGCGALLGDVQKIAIDSASIVREVTVYADDVTHLDMILERLGRIPGISVEAVTDEVLRLHEQGKLRVKAAVELKTLLDLQKIYTPGVAAVSRYIHDRPDELRRYTWAANTVAIVSDGSAVLGLGDLGPGPALPVLEGKAVILDQLAGVGCVPIVLNTQDVERIVATVECLATGFGAIMLEDIAAPRCFEIESRLGQALDIPVFHDDQHGTAVVVVAGLENACRTTGIDLSDMRVVISGAGAAGLAIARLLISAGATDLVCCDRKGAIHEGRAEHMNPFKEQIAGITNSKKVAGGLADVIKGAHAFVGVSSPGLVTKEMVTSMSEPRIVLALANPDPEILPSEALAAGAVVAIDGRTANNALAFPGIIRGALDARARFITDPMKLAAARAIADAARDGLLLPPVLDKRVHQMVAEAVAAQCAVDPA